MNKKKLLLLLPALGLLLTACQGPNTQSGSSGQNPSSSDSSQESGVTGVEVDHETLELQAGQTAKLSASVKPISLEDRNVTWSSDNSEVASVDASGMVTAVAQGTAHIKATANADASKFAECTVTVTARMVTIPKLTVAEVLNATETLKLGANQKNAGGYYYFKGTVDGSTRGETSVSWAEGVTVKLESAGTDKYYVTFGEGANKKYFEMDDVHHFAVVNTPTAGREWSWNETYATVQRTISGQSDAKNNGTFLPGTYQTYTTISGCNLDQAASDFFFQFVYQAAPVAPTSITVKAPADKIYQGGTLQMEAELAPAAAEGKVVWSVTGDEKVTINQEGLLTAAADATLNAKVKVKAAYEKDASIFGEKEITVAELINYGTKEAPLTIAQAKAVLDKTGADTSAQPLFVKGIVSESSYSTKYSNYTIWLQSDDGSVAKDFELYATVLDESITGDYKDANALVGFEVVATGYGKIFTKDNVSTYELTNTKVGDKTVYPTILSMSREEVPATAIALDKTTAEVEVGKTLELKATLTPANATSRVSWKSSDTAKATVEKGKVTGVAAGNATITAFIDADGDGNVGATELKAECAVTVKEQEGGGGQEGTKVTLNIADYATANSVASGTKVSSIALDAVVTAKAEGTDANTGKIYIGTTGTTEWRFYKSGTGTIKIELAAGYVLVSAKGGVSTSNYGDPTDTEFTIADNKASYTNTSSNFNIKTLEVVYKAA